MVTRRSARSPQELTQIVRRGYRRLIGRRRLGAQSVAQQSETHLSDGRPALAVLFLGGTARSGTSITARLLGAHPAYVRIPIETKFLSSPGGLCDLVEGLTSYDDFASRMLGRWFDGVPKMGLVRFTDRPSIEAALRELRHGLSADRWAAGRRFTHALFDPVAAAANKPGWIEKFPANVRYADILSRIFPNMRLIHLVRDGRDVATSVLRFPWGPNDADEGLDWWARRLERGFAACDRAPRDRILAVQMEDLIVRDRERHYRRMLDFLGLEDDPAMRTYFDEKVSTDRSHLGRYRTDIAPEHLGAFEAHHDRLARRIWSRGWPYAPVESAELVSA